LEQGRRDLCKAWIDPSVATRERTTDERTFRGFQRPCVRCNANVGVIAGWHCCADRDANSVLQQAMLQVGITPDIFRGNPVGFFLGALDRPSVEALESGEARTARPVLSWDMAVQQFRSDFGEADHATKMPGLDPAVRSEAVAKRRDRAKSVRHEDMLLSRNLLQETLSPAS
jgi:hypothetical protein